MILYTICFHFFHLFAHCLCICICTALNVKINRLSANYIFRFRSKGTELKVLSLCLMPPVRPHQRSLRGFDIRLAKQTPRASLATWSSFLSRHLGLFAAALLGCLQHCSVFPVPSPPHPPCAKKVTGYVAPEFQDTSFFNCGFPPPFDLQFFSTEDCCNPFYVLGLMPGMWQ